MRKHIAFLLVFALTLAAIAGCAGREEDWVERLDLEETYPEAPGQLEKVYTSLEALTADAALIVRVTP